MKRHKCLILAVLMLSMLAGCATEAEITKAEAESAVRAFESDPTLQFDSVEIDKYYMNPSFVPLHAESFKTTYILETETPKRNWNVNKQTGEVCTAIYYDIWDLGEERDIFGPYTQDQCRTIALSYARAKYANFDQQGFVRKDSPWGLNSWSFTWTQTIPPGAITPAYVDIVVSPDSGQVVRYAAEHFTMSPITSTPITQQQAVTAALAHWQITTVNETSTPQLYVDPDGVLYYSIYVDGVTASGRSMIYSVTLNAVTGVVLWSTTASGSKPPVPKKAGTAAPTAKTDKALEPVSSQASKSKKSAAAKSSKPTVEKKKQKAVQKPKKCVQKN